MSDVGYLLDTNVVSETRRRSPHENVAAFLGRLEPEQMFVSALTVGELRKGVEMRRRTDWLMANQLSAWLDKMEDRFRHRILPVDAVVADIWGRLAAVRSRPIIDTLIAATALERGMTLVTRNVADMRDTGVLLTNPWAPLGQME